MRSQDRLVRDWGDSTASCCVRRTSRSSGIITRTLWLAHWEEPHDCAGSGAMLKGDESVTAGAGQWYSKRYVAVADPRDMCGQLATPGPSALTANNKLAVGEAVGRGLLFVMWDLLKETYQGSVPIQTVKSEMTSPIILLFRNKPHRW